MGTTRDAGQTDLAATGEVGPAPKKCRVSNIDKKRLVEAIRRAGAEMMEFGGICSRLSQGPSQTEPGPPSQSMKYLTSPLEEENMALKQRVQQLEAEAARKHELEEQVRLANEEMRSLQQEKHLLKGQVSQLLVLLDRAVEILHASPDQDKDNMDDPAVPSEREDDEASPPSQTGIMETVEPFQQHLEDDDTTSATAPNPDHFLRTGADTPTTNSSSLTITLGMNQREEEGSTISSTIDLGTIKREPTDQTPMRPPPPSPELIYFASQLGLRPAPGLSQNPIEIPSRVSSVPQRFLPRPWAPQPTNVNRNKGDEELMLLHSADKSKEKNCICGKTFANLVTLAGHIQYHIVEWKFCCKRCNQRFYSTNTLRKHMGQMHAERMSDRMMGCHSCGGLFEGRVALFRHKRSGECGAQTQKTTKDK